jgi:V8-like Glu-specific endopeptidase
MAIQETQGQGGPTVRTEEDEPISNGDLLLTGVEAAEGPGEGGPAAAATDEGTEAVDFKLPADMAFTSPSEAAAAVLADDTRLPDIAEASFGAPAVAIAETVQGADDRVQVTNTAVAPWRMHASLQITAADGSLWIGTGWFISPRVLVTAGHVVYIQHSGVPGRDGWVREITVIPGRNGSTMPFGSSKSVRFYTVHGWSDGGSEEYDYGAIVLPDKLGERTGWFGLGAYSDDVLATLAANVSGYPGDKPSGTQWYHARRVDSTGVRKVFYDTDTAGGQSGSAVYRIHNGQRYAFAVHAYGGARVNSGTRITRPVFDNLQAWKAAHP